MEAVKPHLDHKAEFEALLANYKIAESSLELFDQLQFVVLTGIAGGGRNSVINHLVAQDNYYFIVSDTTRPPKFRDGKFEEDGVQYFFRSESDVLDDIKAGRFLEAELIHQQQVSGISLRELRHAVDQGRVAIAEVEYQGANNIAAANPSAHMIGLLPPSFDTWMQRVRDREVLAASEYRNRMVTAEKVVQNLLDNPRYAIVINSVIDHAADDVRCVIAGNYPTDKQLTGYKIAQQLLASIQDELERLSGTLDA